MDQLTQEEQAIFAEIAGRLEEPPANVAQGDLHAVQVMLLPVPVEGRPIPAGGMKLPLGRWGRRRHVVTDCTSGVLWHPYGVPGGKLGLITVPADGHAVIEHLDRVAGHAPVTLRGGPGGAVYELRQQRRQKLTAAEHDPNASALMKD